MKATRPKRADCTGTHAKRTRDYIEEVKFKNMPRRLENDKEETMKQKQRADGKKRETG